MRNRFTVGLMVGLVGMLGAAAFAVTGDATKPLFGWNSEMLNWILPLIIPFLVSVFSKLSWADSLKRGLLAFLCLLATGAVGWLGGFIVKTDLTTINVLATFAGVFGVSNLLYMLLAVKVFKPITAKVGITDEKKVLTS